MNNQDDLCVGCGHARWLHLNDKCSVKAACNDHECGCDENVPCECKQFVEKVVEKKTDEQSHHDYMERYFTVLAERLVEAMESQAKALARIANHLEGSIEPSTLNEEEKEMVKAGQLIQAIKAYKARTGLGLGPSKEAIEHYKKFCR